MKKSNITLFILTIIVVLTVIYGYLDGGSPKSAQNKRSDSTRVQNIRTIKNWVNSYFQTNKILPKTILEASKGSNSPPSMVIPTEVIPTDPETKNDYEYASTSLSEFKVCATFSESTLNNTSDKDFEHPSGYYCYTFTAGKY